MKNLTILGSTGSVGKQTLEVIAANPEQLRVVALVANKNDVLLEEQIRKFQPQVAVLHDEQAAKRLRARYTGSTTLLTGDEGVLAAATCPQCDTVLAAMVGYAGLRPTLAAIEAGKDIALANKETLVAAGSIVMAAVKNKQVKLTPVDSEHSAIFQCLQGNRHKEVKRIIITASGGPFRTYTPQQMEHVTVEQCLHHPNWSMGKKVTVDSATLANKGLEVMEAHWLFDQPYDKIKPIIHPQSIVHSMVEYIDGSVMAQLGLPDMRLPIQYALSHSARWDNAFGQLDLTKIGTLTFQEPDLQVFPALGLALASGRAGGTLPCAFNAANEIAVEAFLQGKVKYLGIARVIEQVLAQTTNVAVPSLEDIELTDQEARQRAQAILAQQL